MSWVVNKRNRKWAKKLGWKPSDFDCTKFDRQLQIAIIYFQKEHEDHNLSQDGVCGPSTFRFLSADKPLGLKSWSGRRHRHHLLIGGKWYDIGRPTVYMPLPSKNFKKVKKFFSGRIKLRTVTCCVVHHDATTSAEICFRAVKNGGISTHLCIDNDGVIYQFCDLNDIAWHAGISYWRPKKGSSRKRVSSRNLNNKSIGIDFSNAWYLKYNKKYVDKGFPPREVIEGSRLHGVKLKPHLDMYPAQMESYKVLVSFISKHFNIPLDVPEEDGKLKRGWVKECMKGKFKGFQSHYHSSLNKIDTDIPMLAIMKEIKGNK